MINNNEETFSVIRNTATSLLPDCKILLFGSRARNDNSTDSDYDFLIITKNTIETHRKRALKSQLRKELAKHKIPADILIQSEEEIQIKKEITGHILRQIIKEGIAI
jgi:predicted nucleotidyltransferase